MIFTILSPQGGNSYAIQKECVILPLPVNLSHVIQHLELLLSNCNSFTKPHKQAFVCCSSVWESFMFLLCIWISYKDFWSFIVIAQLAVELWRHIFVFLCHVSDHVLEWINKVSCNCKYSNESGTKVIVVYFIICPSVDFLFCRNIHSFYHVFPSKHLQVKVFLNWSLNN